MGKIKGWKRIREGMYDNTVNNYSYVTLDPDMYSDGSIFWVLHIRTKENDFVWNYESKTRAMRMAIQFMRDNPNG